MKCGKEYALSDRVDFEEIERIAALRAELENIPWQTDADDPGYRLDMLLCAVFGLDDRAELLRHCDQGDLDRWREAQYGSRRTPPAAWVNGFVDGVGEIFDEV